MDTELENEEWFEEYANSEDFAVSRQFGEIIIVPAPKNEALD